MNAPWKAAGQSGRDAFAAFVSDAETLEVLRSVARELGLSPDKCRVGSLRNAVEALSVATSPSILLVDLTGSTDPGEAINALAEVCEPGTLVVAIGPINDVRLYRELLESGIHEYLLKPLAADQLRDTLLGAQAAFSANQAGEPETDKKHCAVAVIGTRGGVGASTLATSLAWLFSTEHELTTGLLDLDVHFGTGALALDLEPGRGLADAIDNPDRIDGLFIERAMIRANERLSILSAETPLGNRLAGDGAAFVRLEEEFRHTFGMTVIDLPRFMLVAFPHLLAEVNVVVIATELTLASARDAIRIQSWLKSNAPQARRLVVANKVLPGGGGGEISRADFEAAIESKLAFLVPYDAKGAAQAAKLGQPFAEANAAAKSGQVLKELAAAVLDARPKDPAKRGVGSRKSLLGRFGELRSLGAARAMVKAGTKAKP